MKRFSLFFVCLLAPFAVWAQQGEYGRVLAGGKWGLISNTGKVLLEPKYDMVYNLRNGYTVVVLEGKRAYVDTNGTFLTPFSFDKAYHFFNDLAVVERDGRQALLNKAGELVVDFSLRYASDRGSFTVADSATESAKLVLNAAGQTIARADVDYYYYDPEAKSRLILKKNGKYGVIDQQGGVVIPFDYASIRRVNAEYFIATKDQRMTHVLDRAGETIYESSDLAVTDFRDGLVVRWDASQRTYGVVDVRGAEILANCYAGVSVGDSRSVLGWMGSRGSRTFVVLDLDEQSRMELECDYLYPFDQNGLSVVLMRNGKLGVINRDGLIIVAPVYDSLGPYVDGLAAARRGEKWGYVDTKGQVAIEPQFDWAWSFSEGLAVVRVGPRVGGKRGYIDREGRYAVEPRFDWAYSFDNGMAHVAFGDFGNGTFGYIDRNGNYLWEPSN